MAVCLQAQRVAKQALAVAGWRMKQQMVAEQGGHWMNQLWTSWVESLVEVEVVVGCSWLELEMCMVVWLWMSSDRRVAVQVVVVLVESHGSQWWMQLMVQVLGSVSSKLQMVVMGSVELKPLTCCYLVLVLDMELWMQVMVSLVDLRIVMS